MKTILENVIINNFSLFVLLPGSLRRYKKWVIYHSGGGENGCVITHICNEKTKIINTLLNSGYIVCSVDVGPVHWGNPKTVKAYNTLYNYVKNKYKVKKEACLLAQSMGGLTVYNWAARNPDKVCGIYGIYPVTDLSNMFRKDIPFDITKSWNIKPKQVKKYAEKYNPILIIKPLAKYNVPIMHRHGIIDKVVKYKENALAFFDKYRKLGGEAKLIRIKNYGHEANKIFFNEKEVKAFFDYCYKGRK